jgi:hypothetical protein
VSGDDLPPTSVAALRAIGNYALIRVVDLSERWLRKIAIFPDLLVQTRLLVQGAGCGVSPS